MHSASHHLKLAGLVLVLAAIFGPVIWPAPAAAQNPVDEPPVVELADGWQYRWEDPPFSDAQKQAVLAAPADDPGWMPLPALNRWQNRGQARILWMRIPLPNGHWRDPSIFLDSVDQGLEAYLGSTLIYRAGQVERSGSEPALGTTHHIILLPEGYQGQTLSLRMYSEYNTIGPRTGVFLGSRADHILNIVHIDIDRFVIATLFLLIAAVMLVFFLRRSEQRAYLALAIFAASAGAFILWRTQLVEFFTTNTFVQEYSKLIAIYTLPVGLASFFEYTVTPGPRRIVRRLWQIHAVYAVAAIGLALLGLVQPLNTVAPFEILVSVTLVIIVAISAREMLRGNPEARLFTVGYSIVLVAAILEISDDLGFIDMPRRVLHWGMFGFGIMLVFILLRRFNQAIEARTQLLTLQRELTIAHRIQQNLLPPARPDWTSPDVLCFTVPAKDMGGDLYTYHAANARRFSLTVGDASGKGMPAALLMAVSLASLRAVINHQLPPGNLLAHLDKIIELYTRVTWQNCALCQVELVLGRDTNSGASLRAANAGCIPPIIRRNNGCVEWMDVGGIPLGVGLGAESGYREEKTTLAPGEMVVLTSDGVVEAHNHAREMFGFERLERAVAAGPTTSAEAMLTHLRLAVEQFVGHTDPHDDMTIVVVRI
ncbi:MAG: hypothetical protein D6768_15110 [Chloroflexi bacterium]|nr:MAG: hypothetical protein D6768_15110 [Chloroflexota bacterium]